MKEGKVLGLQKQEKVETLGERESLGQWGKGGNRTGPQSEKKDKTPKEWPGVMLVWAIR